MAFRGRGRGRGFGARPNYADQKSVPLFPEDVELPNPKYVQGDNALLAWHGRLASYWRSSPYLMEEKATDEKKELVDIETYLHRATKSKRKWTKESASAFLKLEPAYFPLELVEGVKARVNKKVRWKQIKDEEDVFRKYEKGPNKEKVSYSTAVVSLLRFCYSLLVVATLIFTEEPTDYWVAQLIFILILFLVKSS
ncbi:hypothetical protein Droror1_Dr00009880 [Drosera rotundifolia]